MVAHRAWAAHPGRSGLEEDQILSSHSSRADRWITVTLPSPGDTATPWPHIGGRTPTLGSGLLPDCPHWGGHLRRAQCIPQPPKEFPQGSPQKLFTWLSTGREGFLTARTLGPATAYVSGAVLDGPARGVPRQSPRCEAPPCSPRRTRSPTQKLRNSAIN